MTAIIQIPQTIFVTGQLYESLEHKDGIEQALRKIPSHERVAFLPELALARIAADNDSDVWNNGFTTNSLIVTGRGKITGRSKKGGNEYVVVAHVPHELSDPDQIKHLTRENGRYLLAGACEYSRSGFKKLLDHKDDQLIHVIDNGALKKAPYGAIATSSAMNHPLFIPAFGDETTAQNYLEKFEQVKGKFIGILHHDDSDGVPRARLLFLGGDNSTSRVGGCSIDSYYGRFVGVSKKLEGFLNKA